MGALISWLVFALYIAAMAVLAQIGPIGIAVALVLMVVVFVGLTVSNRKASRKRQK